MQKKRRKRTGSMLTEILS